MNLILDVTRITRRRIKGQTLSGIDRVTMAYIQHYQHQAFALFRWGGRSFILALQQSQALFAWLQDPSTTAKLRFILLKGILTPHHIKPVETNFLLNPGYVSIKPLDYQRLMHTLNAKPIFMVHDLIPIQYPEYFNPGEYTGCQQKVNDILAIACGILTNSAATLQELSQYAAQTRQNMPNAKAAPLASGLKTVIIKDRPIEKPYFVIVSNIQPHKNHLLLLHLWRNLFRKIGDLTPHLFVIGQRGWKCQHIFDLLERSPALQKVVTELPHCNDAELSNYIHHSQALLSPSFTEGYGLPVIEALSMGTPVIASDIPIYHEIAGNIPEFIDPCDILGWEKMILEYTKAQSVQRAAQLQRLQDFKKPTWSEHFTHVDELLKASQS
jgi:glycosyltransferase involved in cell wall biosynthesis